MRNEERVDPLLGLRVDPLLGFIEAASVGREYWTTLRFTCLFAHRFACSREQNLKAGRFVSIEFCCGYARLEVCRSVPEGG